MASRRKIGGKEEKKVVVVVKCLERAKSLLGPNRNGAMMATGTWLYNVTPSIDHPASKLSELVPCSALIQRIVRACLHAVELRGNYIAGLLAKKYFSRSCNLTNDALMMVDEPPSLPAI
jgi:hypothetical protein